MNTKSILIGFFLFLSCIVNAQIPTASLVGYYPFTGNANDLSGNSLNGTVYGATLTADRFGNSNSAYNFNGTNNYIQLPAGSYTTLNIYSYSLWMKPNTINGMPIWCGESSYGRGQGFGFNPGQIIFAGSYNQGSSPVQSYITSGTLTTGQWMHVVMIRDYTSVRLFVNGVQVSHVSTANTNNQAADYGTNQPIRAFIGARTLNTLYFNGAIDDVRIYSTALNQSDVTALYNENCFAPYPTLSYTACAGNSVALTAVPGASSSVSWYSSLTSTSAIATGSLFATPTLSVPGTYSYFVGASSCTAYARPMITVNVNPNPTITVNSGSICSGNSFTMQPSGAASYTFSSGSAIVSPASTVSYSVTGTSSAGCPAGNTAVSNITVNTTPTVVVNSGFVCQGESFTLTPSGALSYTFPGGSPVVTPTANTSYLVTGSNNNGCSSGALSNVGVVATPVISVSGPNAVCAGGSANLTANGANFYTWNSGATSSVVIVTPSVTTSYSVTGVNIFGCVGTAVKTISVNPVPVITVNSGTLCAGRVFTLMPSGAATYAYSGGSATVMPLSNSSYTVVGYNAQGCASTPVVATVSVIAAPVVSVNSGAVCSGGSFTIIPAGALSYTYSGGTAVVTPGATTAYTVTGANSSGCTASAISNVTVNPLPVISISNPGYVCLGKSATITASGASTYTWSTGALTSSISVSPSSNTTYFVAGTNSNGCTNSGFATLNVSQLPTITVNSGSVCSGKSFTIVPSGALTYTYSGGSNIVSPVVTTSYSVTGTNAQGCVSSNTAVSNVSVISSPVITVNSGAICSGSSFTLMPSGGSTYTYSGGSAVVSPLTNTNYTVTGANGSGCTGMAVATVSVSALPNLTFVNPGAVCSGNSINIGVSGASSYSWNTGSTSASISVSPLSNSVYSVTGTNAAGCSRTSTTAVVVNPLPVITASSGSVCAGKSYTIIASGASTYTYSGGSNIVTPLSNTSYSVYGTSAQGCVAASPAVSNVNVNPLPAISVNSGAICVGSSFTMAPAGGVTYTYSGGSAVVSPIANTNYTVTGASSVGCTNTAVSIVIVNALPVVTITNPGPVCIGSSLVLTAGGANSYSWNTGSTSTSISVSPGSTSTFTVTGTNSNGCKKTSTTTVIVNPLPVIGVNSGSICAGKSFTIIPTGAATYTYSGGSNIVSPPSTTSYSVYGTSAQGCVGASPAISNVTVNTLPVITVNSGAICVGASFTMVPSGGVSYTYSGGSAVVSPSSNTNYTVTGASSIGCTNTVISTVGVNTLPVVTISNPGPICNGASVVLTAGGANTYSWNTGPTSASITVSPGSTSSYTVTGTNSNGCIKSSSTTVIVNPLPIISVNSGSICSGKSFTIVPTGAASYTYSGGSNIVSPVTNTTYSVSGTSAQGCVSATSAISSVAVIASPVISVNSGSVCAGGSFTIIPTGALSYTVSGGAMVVSPASTSAYSVTGTSAAGCISSNTAIASVTVVNLPAITVSGNSAICAGNTISLSASGANTYTWNTGFNGSTLVASPTVNLTYTVTGTGAGACINSQTAGVVVNALPIITANSGSICAGSSFVILPSGANTYTISGGSGTVSPASTTSYSVTGTSTAGCLSANAAIATVTVNALPSLSITAPSAICAGNIAQLTGAGAASYSWTNLGAGASVTVNPVASASYTLTGTSAEGCASVLMHSIAVNPLPTITVSGGAVCPGNSFTLNPSGALTYTYSGGSNIVTPVSTTSYSVTGTDAMGCVSAVPAVATVSVVNTLTVTITGNQAICEGDSLVLTANGAGSYSWSTGATGNTVILKPVATAGYTVLGQSGNCSDTASTTVTVNTRPVVTINSGAVCAGNPFVLTPAGALSYTYSSGSATVNPAANAIYTVVGVNASGCISLPAIAQVTVQPLPNVTAGSTQSTICEGESVVLFSSGALSYVWSNGDNSDSTSVSPVVSQTYTVTGTDAGNCSSTALVAISVDPCTGLQAVQSAQGFVVFPNPGTGQFVIRGDVNAGEITHLYISDVQGKIIRHYALDDLSSGQTINSGLIPGIYLGRLTLNNKTVHTARIIITN